MKLIQYQLLLNEYKNIVCYEKATEIKLDKLKSFMVPWINKRIERKLMIV